MLVRNNKTCPSCGLTSGAHWSIVDKARVISRFVPVTASCDNCGFERVGLYRLDDLYERLVKGYFWSLNKGKGIPPVWSFNQMKEYSHRYKVILLNRLRAKDYDHGSNFENPWFCRIADDVFGRSDHSVEILNTSLRGLGL